MSFLKNTITSPHIKRLITTSTTINKLTINNSTILSTFKTKVNNNKSNINQNPTTTTTTTVKSKLFKINNENTFSRSFYSQRLKIIDHGDKNPMDDGVQEIVYKELVEMGDYETVINRFETMGYAANEECVRYYFKSLVFSNKLDRAHLSLSKISESDILKHIKQLETPTQDQPSSSSSSSSPPITLPPYSISFILPDAVKEKINQKPMIPVIRIGEFGPMRMSMGDRIWGILWIPVLAIGIFLFILKDENSPTVSTSSGSKNKTVAKEYTDTANNKTTFDDIKGIDEVKAELIEIVDYLKNPEKYDRIGAKLPRGILLSGEPGTGKTLLARAIAGEAGVPFLYTSGSSFDEKYIGVGAKRVRELFDLARSQQPCIIFIDEIDAAGRNRISSRFNETLLQLLTEMDGFAQENKIMVIGATNSPESLDAALTRPGRFDRQIAVPIPDFKGRKEIVEFYLSKVSHDEDKIKPEKIARSIPGFTGADISNLINTAAIKAVLNGQDKVTLKMIDEARDDILMGRERKSSIISEETKRNTAYHEAGHALVAAFTESSDPIHKATIIQRGHALGMVSQVPESDHHQFTRKQMMARLAICLAGRAAEEVFFGREMVTSGASSDFQQASKLATAMVTKWGMSDKLGYTFHHDKMSQGTLNTVDFEIKNLLDKQYDHAKTLIIKHKDKMHLLMKFREINSS
ncbi:ATP-dependent metalloprotease [Cavenderia fasciculata]|uniref:ATP-dependent metalloprotease n=1 Tax=Cavenderia fasciculata TaxID=261658 RepID=F4QBK3_CACFS|nr:ATP-dependent metalloprotease [Cavenderia fasciculata]EGG14975.1 ATP-dependent metalloprotease [Cavenderia fasciculata]|eukprot:XP_004351491.1 ATP-dependent metalloprotease [Cavenderia fasciculata]